MKVLYKWILVQIKQLLKYSEKEHSVEVILEIFILLLMLIGTKSHGIILLAGRY